MSKDIEEIEIVNESIDEIVDMTPKLLEDLGSRFPTKKSKERKRYGKFQCQYCGKEFVTQTQDVKNKATKSCGCIKGEKHNESGKRLYNIWMGMKQRCYNQNESAYKYYGEQGITVYNVWKDSYIAFKEWSLANGYTDDLSIDRIDINGNYEPDNCRWTTNEVQARNTRVLRSTNTSGFRGVSWHKRDEKWQVNICVNYIYKYLGSFNTAIEGAMAYNNYVIENNLEHTLNIIPKESSDD